MAKNTGIPYRRLAAPTGGGTLMPAGGGTLMPAGEPRDYWSTPEGNAFSNYTTAATNSEGVSSVIWTTTQTASQQEPSPSLLEKYKDFTLGGLVGTLEAECASRDRLAEDSRNHSKEVSDLKKCLAGQYDTIKEQAGRIRKLEGELDTINANRAAQTDIIHEQEAKLIKAENTMVALGLLLKTQNRQVKGHRETIARLEAEVDKLRADGNAIPHIEYMEGWDKHTSISNNWLRAQARIKEQEATIVGLYEKLDHQAGVLRETQYNLKFADQRANELTKANAQYQSYNEALREQVRILEAAPPQP